MTSEHIIEHERMDAHELAWSESTLAVSVRSYSSMCASEKLQLMMKGMPPAINIPAESALVLMCGAVVRDNDIVLRALLMMVPCSILVVCS